MMKKITLYWFMSLVSLPVIADGGADIYQTCVACHGQYGAGNTAMGAPALAGQSASYIERQLHAFKYGRRGTDPHDSGGQLMRAAATVLTDDNVIRAVALYSTALSGSAKSTESQPISEVTQKNGKAMYLGICAACHGVNGEGLETLAAPRLNSLTATYVIKQLQAYKNGSRGSLADDNYGRQMQQMAALLADEQQIAEVAEYITSVKQ